MRLAALPLILLLVSPALSAEPDVVKLNYAWESGMKGSVSYRFSRTRTHQQEPVTDTITGSYIFTTSEHPDGLQIDLSDMQTKVESSNDIKKDKIQQLLEKLAQIHPSYIISKEGELLGVIGLEQIRDELNQEMKSWFAGEKPEVHQKMEQILQAFLSKEQLMTQLNDDWNREVGQWIGAEFEKGNYYEIEFESTVPALGNITVPTRGKYEYLGRTACNEQDKKERCVKLYYVSGFDPEAAQNIVIALFRQMNTPVPENFSIVMDYALEVITEPSTLRPHSIRERKIFATGFGERPDATRQEEIKVIDYTYL